MKKISKIRWAQLAALTLLVGLGWFATFSQRDFAPIDEPRRHFRRTWDLVYNPPVAEDAPVVTIPAAETEVISKGSNLEIRFPAPPADADESWSDRVDSLIRSDEIGRAEFHGAELKVTHAVIRIQTDADAFQTSIFSLPDWNSVESGQTPMDLRAEILNLDQKNRIEQSLLFPIQLLFRVEVSDDVLGVRSPYLTDRQLQTWLPNYTGIELTVYPQLRNGVCIVTFDIVTRHQS
ncbi:MAG: hypothetical protein AAF585_27540, partial [Verrucomicrobiota bacterium]